MKLRIVGHPAKRMVERGISVADVEHALANFQTSIDSAKKNSIAYVGPGQDGRALKVWVLPPGIVGPEATIIVKSVAWKDEEV